MKRVLIAPHKYVQGRDVLDEIGSYLGMLGKNPLILWDQTVQAIVGERVRRSIQAAQLNWSEAEFAGEATRAECDRVVETARNRSADCVAGIGGGKVLDIAKAAAVKLGVRLMTCPTLASTDAPTSAATVWYDEEHNFVGFDCWPFNPDIVLVDTGVIAQAPVRTFVAGMGDALSTWIEARAAFESRAPNIAGGRPTMAAMTLARLCFDTLVEHGREAKRAVELGLVTPAVEKVVEANVLLSGLGFESGGLATAHMVANLLSNLPECRTSLLHGEKVGFGIVTQMCLEDEFDPDQRALIVDFEIDIGLPVTFSELNLGEISRERLRRIAEACAAEGSLCRNHPFPVGAEDVLDAMIDADALGRERHCIRG